MKHDGREVIGQVENDPHTEKLIIWVNCVIIVGMSIIVGSLYSAEIFRNFTSSILLANALIHFLNWGLREQYYNHSLATVAMLIVLQLIIATAIPLVVGVSNWFIVPIFLMLWFISARTCDLFDPTYGESSEKKHDDGKGRIRMFLYATHGTTIACLAVAMSLFLF